MVRLLGFKGNAPCGVRGPYWLWRDQCWVALLVMLCVWVPHLFHCQQTAPFATYKDNNSNNNNAKGKGPLSSPDLDPVSGRVNQTRELELRVEKETLNLKMTEVGKVTVNFTLLCSHPSVRYTIRLSTDNTDVAFVDTANVHNITCRDAKPRTVSELQLHGNNSHVAEGPPPANTQTGDFGPGLDSFPIVRGAFNFSLKADLLGRTWLRVLGERHADPEVDLPDFIAFPWKQPQMLKRPAKLASLNSSLTPSTTAARFNGTVASAGSEEFPYVVFPGSQEVTYELEKHVVTVTRVVRPIDMLFRGVLYSFVMLSTVGMGCKTEMSVVKEVLKKPVAPGIGFICQYLFMPLIAFMVAKTLVVGDPAVSLGIFACGICPGGGPSNMYSYLLDGDVSLSVTMTALSSVAALAMIPLWLFTLGVKFEDDKISLNVPFVRILITLAFIIIPLFIGLLVKKFLPKVAKWVLKVLKPFTLLALLFLVTFGVYTNLYVFRLFSPITLAAGCMLPYIGYVLGVVVSLLLRQPCYRVKTIAIETGIQNTSIAYLLLIFSLPAPDGDMAAVGPMASALMTPLPLLLLVVVYLLYKRFCKKEKNEKEDGERAANEKKKVAVGEGDEEEGVALTDQVVENGHKNGT